jgi:hypothetical protein
MQATTDQDKLLSNEVYLLFWAFPDSSRVCPALLSIRVSPALLWSARIGQNRAGKDRVVLLVLPSPEVRLTEVDIKSYSHVIFRVY